MQRLCFASLALAAALLASAGATFAKPPSAASGLVYERTLMASAGSRCGLFAPSVETALKASAVQARGAALRAGDPVATVDATEGRARARAASVDCRAPGLLTAAERVRSAFADYSKMSVMRFPGPRSAWRAERPDPRLTGSRWRLVEALPGSGGWLLFGVVDGAPALLDARRGAEPAAYARLGVRDPQRLSAPILDRAPPAGVSRVFLASRRLAASSALLPAGATRGALYPFPRTALDALAALDPREVARVELVYPSSGRDRVVAGEVEVGDLAAALAFLGAGSPR